ncbi:hypothetical protein D0Z08_21240 [Nocardioides immobilis]|uniref:Uncharacterized protein n=1 Tax=Nocardioides immobilis TaxID=2049295 RepID=A0A417XX70_9ACTN|nr:hypothetical protein D0Z08_21240 [Nocardioides immobilis]
MVGGGPVGGGVVGIVHWSEACAGSCGMPHERQNRSVSLARCAPHDVQKPMWNSLLRWAAPRRT